MKSGFAPPLVEQFPDVSSEQVMDLFGMVWEHFPENMFLVQQEDDDFRILAVNPSQASVFGKTAGEIAGMRLGSMLNEEAFLPVRERYLACLAQGRPSRYEEQVNYEGPDGVTAVGVWSTLLVPILNEEGVRNILFGVSQDVTAIHEAQWALQRQNQELEQRVAERTRELELLNQQLSEAASLDPLTRVFNRRRLNEVGEEEFQRARRYHTELSVIILDVDEFKAFNEDHGHAYGDHILVEVIDSLRTVLRKTDILARYGGDEFVVLLPHTDAAAAAQVAEKMRQTVATGQHCSISLGLTALRADDAGMPVALERADAALRAAKKQGRNRLLVMA